MKYRNHQKSANVSQLRLSRGQLKGSLVHFTEHKGLRPTHIKVREAVFSMLVPYVSTHGFVDVFAGSGAMAFEAFSCGFQPVILAEAALEARRHILSNAKRLNVTFHALVSDALSLVSLAAYAPARDSIELVGGLPDVPLIFYCDPPFDQPALRQQFLERLTAFPNLHSDSLLLMEYPKEDTPLEHNKLQILKHKHYGRISLLMYQIIGSRMTV